MKKAAFLGVLLSALLAENVLGGEAAGSLVFCRRRKSEAGTYVSDARGRDMKRIMFLCGPEISPRFAPDGKRIVFSCVKAGKASVWIADRDGGERKEVCEGDQAAWSPDGARIFFRRAGQLLERLLQSGEERVVSPPGWKSCAFPDCSPDGKSLLFAAEVEGGAKLFVTAIGGRDPRALADLGVVSPARWSPEGSRIAYSDGAHIFVMDADRTWRYRLTSGGGLDRCPAWSPEGNMLAYCHAAMVNGGWTLCITTDDGGQTRGVFKDDEDWSYFGADWRAAAGKPVEAAATTRPPARVSVWDTTGSQEFVAAKRNEWVQAREAWRLVSGPGALQGGVAIENGRALLVLHPKASAAFLWPKPVEKETQAVELVPLSESGEEAGKVASLRLARCDNDEAVVELSSSTAQGQAARTMWWMCGGGPCVQLSPVENAGSVRIRAAMKHAVIPDRFADDLLYEPARCAGGRVALPDAPMLLGFAGSGDALLELASHGSGQTMDLLREAAKEKPFSGAEVRFAKRAVTVGILTGKGLWREERPNAKYDRKRMDLNWEMPIPGTWRLALRVGGMPFSETFMDKGSPRFDNKKLFLTPNEEFAGVIDLALVYLYGCSPGTPLDKWTPADVALDGMGIESFTGALDIDGLLSYRTAPRPTTWADIFATVRSLDHIYSRGAEKEEKAFVERLCDDIPVFLEGMDGRLDAFAAFSREAARMANNVDAPPEHAQAFLTDLWPALDKLDDACKKREKLPPAAEAAGYAAQFRALAPKDAKEVPDKRRTLSTLCDKLSEAAKGRADLIRAFRNAARELRDCAGMSCAEHPEFRGLVTEIRRLAQGVLRQRYYFEGGWRGELPRVAPCWTGASLF